MPELIHKIPCAQCPFLRTSLPGYLGASTPEDFIESTLWERFMPCHLGIDYEDKDWEKTQYPTAPMCAGSLMFLRNNCKLPLNEELRDMTRSVSQNPDVFSWADEFIAHHRSGVCIPEILGVNDE